MQVFNARTQQLENVTWAVDANNEIIATFQDGSFLKFPAGQTVEQLQSQVEAHRLASSGQEVITPEMEEQRRARAQASQQTVNQLNGNTMPQEDQTNAPDQPVN